jgi:hypothetical protein
MGRGKAWWESECVALCQAWVTVAKEDRISAVSQKPAFFDKLHMAYTAQSANIHSRPGHNDPRSNIATRAKWKEISRAVVEFDRHLREVRGEAGADETATDDEYTVLMKAIARQNGIAGAMDPKFHPKSQGGGPGTFEFMASWQFLRKVPEFWEAYAPDSRKRLAVDPAAAAAGQQKSPYVDGKYDPSRAADALHNPYMVAPTAGDALAGRAAGTAGAGAATAAAAVAADGGAAGNGGAPASSGPDLPPGTKPQHRRAALALAMSGGGVGHRRYYRDGLDVAEEDEAGTAVRAAKRVRSMQGDAVDDDGRTTAALEAANEQVRALAEQVKARNVLMAETNALTLFSMESMRGTPQAAEYLALCADLHVKAMKRTVAEAAAAEKAAADAGDVEKAAEMHKAAAAAAAAAAQAEAGAATLATSEGIVEAAP